MRLVQLVPELPPAVGGVGDYAALLAEELVRLGIRTTFVIPDRPPGEGLGRGTTTNVSPIPPRADALAGRLDALHPDAVLLHYSGYGYAKRGAPVWLVQGLRRWQARAPGGRLVVMFHELWAYGPPWTSSFWLSPVQRALAAALLRLGDALFTNTDLYARRLRRLTWDRQSVTVLPVLSNIGETVDPRPLDAREPLAVVFGKHGTRARAYAAMAKFLPILRAAGIERIVDIGPPVDERVIVRSPLPVFPYGYLDPTAASRAMSRARFGLLDYSLDLAAKSGIFAAYAAHGVVPLIRSAMGGSSDGLRHGVNLVRTDHAPVLQPRYAAQRLASAIHAWYQEHALQRTAACFAHALGLIGPTAQRRDQSAGS
jgi:Glycosyl transferase 4-like domain